MRLRNCPFDALVDEHRDLTCSMNLALLEGVVEGVGELDVVASADPREGYCCVTLDPQTRPEDGGRQPARAMPLDSPGFH